MMLRHADAEGRRHHGPKLFADAMGDQFGAERVGTDEAGRPVLLGRADRNDDPARVLEIGLDFLPGTKL